MGAETRTTSGHDESRRWVEEHDGVPATVRGTHDGEDAAGMLRFDFPGGAGENSLEHISWDAWFQKFDAEGLQLLYQLEKSDGGDSTFFKVVSPD
jgi:hypothetical protein